MKAGNFFKTIKCVAIVAVSALIAASCENKSSEQASGTDAAKEATAENEIKFENKKQEKDARFLVDATAFNLEQIQLARLGEQKGNADIKKLSTMMLAEHEKALKEGSEMAKNKQITVPDTTTTGVQDSYKMLNDKNGNDFNTAFCDRLVENHQKAVGFFEKESADSRDMDLKEWATAKLSDIRKHLDHIFACQKKLEKK